MVYDAKLDNKAGCKAIEEYNLKYVINKEEIIKLRKSHHLSQELFAKIIGCAKKTLISYEKGTSIPNDIYTIVLNSLLNKPDTLITLIESNKNHFTTKEYRKIKEQINKSNVISDKEVEKKTYLQN